MTNTATLKRERRGRDGKSEREIGRDGERGEDGGRD